MCLFIDIKSTLPHPYSRKLKIKYAADNLSALVDSWTCADHGFVLHLIFLTRKPSGHLFFFINLNPSPQPLLEISASAVSKLYPNENMVNFLQIPRELKPVIVAQFPQKIKKLKLTREILYPFLFEDDNEDALECCALQAKPV